MMIGLRKARADRTEPSAQMLLVLTFAAMLRTGLAVWAYARTGTTVMTQGDTASYITPGLNLLQHGVFSSRGVVEIDRTPGYPIFAMISGMWGNHVSITIGFQIALSLLSLLVVYRIANLAFPVRRPGSAAAWLFAVEPISITYSIRLMPETLFLFLLLVVMERVITYQKTGRLGAVTVAAASLVAATYVRPVSYYLLPAFAIGLMFTGPGRRLHWKASMIFLLVTIPCIGAWRLRNVRVANYDGFSSVVDKNLYFYQAAGVSARLSHQPLAAVQERLGYSDDAAYLTVHPEQARWSRAERLGFMRREGVTVLARHPILSIESQLAGSFVVAFTPCTTELLQLLNLSPASEQMPQRVLSNGLFRSVLHVIDSLPLVSVTMLMSEAYLALLYTLAIWGALKVTCEKAARLTLIATASYFVLISGGAQAVGRYRMPVMPELCVLAGAGIAQLQEKRRSLIGPAIDLKLEQVRS